LREPIFQLVDPFFAVDHKHLDPDSFSKQILIYVKDKRQMSLVQKRYFMGDSGFDLFYNN